LLHNHHHISSGAGSGRSTKSHPTHWLCQSMSGVSKCLMLTSHKYISSKYWKQGINLIYLYVKYFMHICKR
jgi:hypothetical protein